MPKVDLRAYVPTGSMFTLDKYSAANHYPSDGGDSVRTIETGMLSSSKAVSDVKTSHSVFRRMSNTLRDESLLRGMPAFRAIARGGQIFQNRAGTQETFNLSAPVKKIRWFISHNWSVSNVEKFAVLALHFNLIPASVITCLVMFCIFGLTAAGQLPRLQIVEEAKPWESDNAEVVTTIGVVAQGISTLVFLVVLFTWHEVGGRIGLLRASVFIDKACINQCDMDLKMKGISSLAAFLGRTEGMIVVYTDLYLRRMWTVYELAAVLILVPDIPVLVLPTFMPAFVVVGSLIIYFSNLLQLALSWEETRAALEIVSASVLVVVERFLLELCFCCFVRILAKRSRHVQAAAEAFYIKDADCCDEGDRHLVCNSVAHFMQLKGLVRMDASYQESLDAFDKLVRKEVPRFLTAKHWLPYRIVVVTFLPTLANLVDWEGAALATHGPSWNLLHRVALSLGYQFLFVPSWVKIASLALRRQLHLQGFSELVFTGCISFVLAIFGEVGELALGYIESRSRRENRLGTFTAIEISVWTCLLVLTVLLYRPRCLRPAWKPSVNAAVDFMRKTSCGDQ